MRRLTLDEIETLSLDAVTRAGASDRQARPPAHSIRRVEADRDRLDDVTYERWRIARQSISLSI
jgi:hypothetical protein